MSTTTSAPSTQEQIEAFVAKWKLNQPLLAAKMNIAPGTFKGKVSRTLTAYKFSADEQERFKQVLAEMKADIDNITF